MKKIFKMEIFVNEEGTEFEADVSLNEEEFNSDMLNQIRRNVLPDLSKIIGLAFVAKEKKEIEA